jgi:hypothetical protein
LEVLRDKFKIHLLDALLTQLDSTEGIRVPDFVERSQLLLQICTANGSQNSFKIIKFKEKSDEFIRKDNEGNLLFLFFFNPFRYFIITKYISR